VLLLLPSASAMAEMAVRVSDVDGSTSIEAKHETLVSVLQYYHDHYNTTVTLPATIAEDKINANVTGKSLAAATQALLRRYNIAMVEGEHETISHISVLPVGDQPDDLKLLNIGKLSSEDMQTNRMMRQHLRHGGLSGRNAAAVSRMRGGRYPGGGWHRSSGRRFFSGSAAPQSQPYGSAGSQSQQYGPAGAYGGRHPRGWR